MTLRDARLPIVAALAMLAAVVSADERPQFTIVVGGKPVEVRRTRDSRADVIETASTGTCLDVISEVDGWFWVTLSPDAYGTRRSGWVSGRVVRRPPPGAAVPPADSCGSQGVRRVAEEPSTSVIADAPVRTLADAVPGRTESVLVPADDRIGPEPALGGGPLARDGSLTLAVPSFVAGGEGKGTRDDRPAGSRGTGKDVRRVTLPYPRPPRAAVPDDLAQESHTPWFQVRSLRGSLGGGVEGVSVGYNAAVSDQSGILGLAGIDVSFAIIDPRLLTVSAGADLQQSSVRQPTLTTGGAFRNYRLELATRTGRDSPLHLFANRTTAALDLTPLGPQDLVYGRTRGTRTSRGVSWIVNTPRLPKFEFSTLSSRQTDDRDPQLGLDSSGSESRTMLRAFDDGGRLRYDVNYAHRGADYQVQQAAVSTRTSDDVLNTTVHAEPGRTLTVDANGRASRYRDDVNGVGRYFDGLGGGVALRWQFRPRWTAGASYDFSTNVIEALLNGLLDPTVPGVGGPAASGIYRTKTLFQHADGRVAYVTDHATIEAVLRDISYGVPAFQPPTLSDLRTGGGAARFHGQAGGFDLGAAVDFAAGTARSNRSLSEPYLEGGVQASISRAFKQAARVTVEGGVRRTSRLVFYPLLLDADSFGVRVESQGPSWATVRAAVRWSKSLRDGLSTGIREQHTAYTLGLSGPRYDIAVDYGLEESLWLALPADVIGRRIDAAVLLASRPDLYLNLYGGRDQIGTLTGTIRPFRGFSVRARALQQHRRYQGVDDWELLGGQIAGTYQLRELQIEFGWERMDSTSIFYDTRDRRFYIRVRRDISIF